MVKVWVDFDKNMIYGNQIVAKGHFLPFFGTFSGKLSTILESRFGGCFES